MLCIQFLILKIFLDNWYEVEYFLNVCQILTKVDYESWSPGVFLAEYCSIFFTIIALVIIVIFYGKHLV